MEAPTLISNPTCGTAQPRRKGPRACLLDELPGRVPELLSQHFSDYGNSERLITLYGDRLRYCHAFKRWLVWDGRRWAVDDVEHARHLSQDSQDMILEFARQALAAKNQTAAKFAATCLNSKGITNALREAQPHLGIRPAELDTDPDLLNCRNGTLNLKTGRLREHRRADFITKLVHRDHRPEARCPLFLAFLNRITANHPGLLSYLQKAFGYSLTGHTIEKAVFLLHGRGDNGKSTLLTLFLKLLKEYASPAPDRYLDGSDGKQQHECGLGRPPRRPVCDDFRDRRGAAVRRGQA